VHQSVLELGGNFFRSHVNSNPLWILIFTLTRDPRLAVLLVAAEGAFATAPLSDPRKETHSVNPVVLNAM
jgi:hypothetical protein